MEPVGVVLYGIFALACVLVSIFQFREQGFLFHNAYLYATKEQRARMDKAPYYRQSGIVFAGLGTMFLLMGIQSLTGRRWLYVPAGAAAAAVLIYAVASSLRMEKRR